MAKLINIERGFYKEKFKEEDHFMKAMQHAKDYYNEIYSGKELEIKLKEIDDAIKEWESLNNRL